MHNKQMILLWCQDRCSRLLEREPQNWQATNLLAELDKLNMTAQVLETMKIEHGDLANNLSEAKWKVEKIRIAKIIPQNKQHLARVASGPDYYSTINLTLPIGLVQKQNANYLLLDGYHRLAHLQKINFQDLVLVLVNHGLLLPLPRKQATELK